MSLKSHDPGGLGDVDRCPDQALPGMHATVRVEDRERLVDRAVVALVVDHDLAAATDVAGKADREAVRIRGRQRELPGRQPEPPLELLAGPDGVLGREHVRDAAAELALDGGDRRSGAVAGHRPGVAEAEIDVLVAVDAGEPGAGGFLDEQGERAGPADHPVHRDAVEERCLGALVQLLGARMFGDEARGLVGHVARETRAIERAEGRHPGRMARRRTAVSAIPAGATSARSVGAAGEAADRAGRDAGGRIDLEEAGAPVGAAEDARAVVGGGRAAAHAAHGAGTTGKGRGGGTGHHGMDTRVAFWRATGGLILGRGR